MQIIDTCTLIDITQPKIFVERKRWIGTTKLASPAQSAERFQFQAQARAFEYSSRLRRRIFLYAGNLR